MSEIDHLALAESRLATQFRESTNLINYIRTLLLEANNLEDVFCDLKDRLSIELMGGVNLDIIGAIVGQPREIIDAELFIYFGFAVNIQSQSFGTLINPGVGGNFLPQGTPTTGLRTLTDHEYRVWIRARIAKNTTRSTPDDIISQLQYIFGAPQIIFIDGDTEYSVSIGKILTENEKAILFGTNIVPKTAGVRVNYVTNYNAENVWGFSGVPGAMGFGELGSSELGGEFGSLIF